MNTVKTIALAGLTLVLAGDLSAQTLLWDESVQGDLPASFGTIPAGSNLVFGAVGDGGGGDPTTSDVDWVLFNIPVGLSLQELFVETVNGNFLFYQLDRVTLDTTNAVAFHMFPSGQGSFDLLWLAQPYGPQPAATYLLGVGPALGDSSLRHYALDLVVAPVPEPATGWLLAPTLLLMLWRGQNRVFIMRMVCPKKRSKRCQ